MELQELLEQFSDSGVLAGGAFFILFIFGAILIAFLVIYIIGAVKLYQKAEKPGWAAIIPFYNTYVLTEIAGLNWWYFLIAIAGTILSMAGLENISGITFITSGVFNFFAFYNIGKRFNKNPVTYGVLAIFFAPILVMILGLSQNNKYDSSIPVSLNGPIEDKTTTTTDERYCLKCGKKLSPNVKFCENCGAEVEK